MVPPYSHRVPRVRRYSGSSLLCSPFVYRTLTFSGLLSHTIPLDSHMRSAVPTPGVLLPLVWPPPLSLATTHGISVDFFSSPYLDVSVQAVPHAQLCIHCALTALLQPGFPIQKSTDITLVYSSPWLIAVYHVFHRLPVPRHSPCALLSLTSFSLLLLLVRSGVLSAIFARPPRCSALTGT